MDRLEREITEERFAVISVLVDVAEQPMSSAIMSRMFGCPAA
jgi:hypothetical protein